MEKLLIKEYYYGQQTKHYIEDDLVDRLNNKVTILILMSSIFILGAGMYVGKPINCWAPGEFKGQHDSYMNSVCWLKGSYYLPTSEITIPDRSQPRTYFVSYYQWTPFILLGIALSFLFPRLLWHAFARQGGLDVPRLIKAIKERSDAQKGVEHAEKVLQSYLTARDRMQGTRCCGCLWRRFYFGYTLMYFGVKVLYLLNAIAVFFLLNLFLSFNFTGYGMEVLNVAFSGADWFESPRFPRVTMCDFMVRRLGSNQHWFAVQCNLPINLYNEKIFLFLWFWLILLMIMDVLSILSWILSLTEKQRAANLHKYLFLTDPDPKPEENPSSPKEFSGDIVRSDPKNVDAFTTYLKLDGYLIFELIARNTDELIAGGILQHLEREWNKSTSNLSNHQ